MTLCADKIAQQGEKLLSGLAASGGTQPHGGRRELIPASSPLASMSTHLNIHMHTHVRTHPQLKKALESHFKHGKMWCDFFWVMVDSSGMEVLGPTTGEGRQGLMEFFKSGFVSCFWFWWLGGAVLLSSDTATSQITGFAASYTLVGDSPLMLTW